MRLIDLLLEAKGEYILPPDHTQGLKVPKGGSCCANCEYWDSEKESCKNTYYQKWAGTDKIPNPPDEYCSDWWEDHH